METKHTEGEWHVDSGRTPLGDTGDYMPYVVIIGDKLPIAMMSEHFEDDTTEANARLIASAPDLLQALHTLLETMRPHIMKMGIRKGFSEHAALAQAQTAIHKATQG